MYRTRVINCNESTSIILYVSRREDKNRFDYKKKIEIDFFSCTWFESQKSFFFIFLLEFCFVQWNVIVILLNCILHYVVFFVQKLAIIDFLNLIIKIFCWCVKTLSVDLFSLKRKAFIVKHKNASLITQAKAGLYLYIQERWIGFLSLWYQLKFI